MDFVVVHKGLLGERLKLVKTTTTTTTTTITATITTTTTTTKPFNPKQVGEG